MREALEQANLAAGADEVPVGAVLVRDNRIIAKAHNTAKQNSNPLLHAEMHVLNEAISNLQTYYLDDCDLYVTLEPCPMCAAAIAHARIKKVVFAAYDVKSGGVDHGAKVFFHTHHKPEVIGGILESESQTLLKNFFMGKR